MSNDADKIEIENVNTPGRVERVDRAKYMAMKEALIGAGAAAQNRGGSAGN